VVCNGVDVESAGPNGLATGCLAAEAKPEAKGFCCGVGCCTAKPLVGVVPLNVVPVVPLPALLSPQDPPGVLNAEKGLGVVALGPVSIEGLLVFWVFEANGLPPTDPLIVGLAVVSSCIVS